LLAAPQTWPPYGDAAARRYHRSRASFGLRQSHPIFWYKIANASYEVENGSSFLGKPYEPNAIIKNDIEFILMLRKPGGYRKPTEAQRAESRLTKEEHSAWFQQVWTLNGASTRDHPAPYPEELAYRLIRMFSFTRDTVLDPFAGMSTSMLAAARCHRNSIGVEIDGSYVKKATTRIENELTDLFTQLAVSVG
jgi:DNA modification methylase